MRARGFTLLELLVAAFLALIVLGLVAQLLFPSFSLFRTQMAYSQAHQSGLTSGHRLKREILNTVMATMTLGSEPTALSLVPVSESAPFDSDGDPELEDRFIVYYLDGEQRLIRKTWPATAEAVPSGVFDGPEPPRLSPTMLADVCNTSNGTERVLARYVEEFVLDDGDSGDVTLLTPPLRFRLTCAVPSGQKLERFTVAADATPQTMRW